MSEFNSSSIEDFHDIWVFCEQRDGRLVDTDFELISEGRKLADERGAKLIGLLLGCDIGEAAKELGGYGADKVIVYDDPVLKVYTNEAYTKVICDIVMDRKPEILLIGASNLGRDLGPRCAARLHTGLTADCTHLDINMENYLKYLSDNSTLELSRMVFDMQDTNLKMTRPAFGGHLMATIICPRFRPCMSTVRPGVLKKNKYDGIKADRCEIEVIYPGLEDMVWQEQVLESVKEAKEIVDLAGADVIISVGNGIRKDPDQGIALARELAEAFGGGVLGASRALIDAGILSPDHQIGQTGKTVRPRIYVALGISGAIQHKAGMQDSELIIAVNKNSTEPIFDVADYGICGDLYKVVPQMISAIRDVKAKK